MLSLLIRAYARTQILRSSMCRCRCSAEGAPMCSCTSLCILSGLLCSCVLVHVIRAALQLLVQPSMPCKARVRVTQRQSINQSINQPNFHKFLCSYATHPWSRRFRPKSLQVPPVCRLCVNFDKQTWGHRHRDEMLIPSHSCTQHRCSEKA